MTWTLVAQICTIATFLVILVTVSIEDVIRALQRTEDAPATDDERYADPVAPTRHGL